MTDQIRDCPVKGRVRAEMFRVRSHTLANRRYRGIGTRLSEGAQLSISELGGVMCARHRRVSDYGDPVNASDPARKLDLPEPHSGAARTLLTKKYLTLPSLRAMIDARKLILIVPSIRNRYPNHKG
jgi:hypothetical protein